MEKLSKNKNFFYKLKKLFFPFYRSKDIKKLFYILEKNKKTHSEVAMFVGGCVRKHLNNENIDDIDIACIYTPEEIKEKFKNSEFKIVDTGIEHGSITIIINLSKFEVTTLRQDIKTDGRHAEVFFTSDWQQDSERRDFTINSIYMDKKGKIYDPQNGRKDLEEKKIKFIGNPTLRIEEDYLRIIRFIRFSIHYDCIQSDPQIIEAIKFNLNGIKNLSKERILSELYKIFRLKNINIILENKDINAIFLIIFPEFKYLERLGYLYYLLEKNILPHSIETIFAILLIDKKDNFEYFCHKYKISNKLKNDLNLISNNYIKFKYEKNFLKKDLKKNIYNLGKSNVKKLVVFIYCSEKKFSYNLLRKTMNEIDKIKIPIFAYNGQRLMDQGLLDGKKIGFALKELEKKWVENNFNLKEEEAISIVSKVKKLNIFNI